MFDKLKISVAGLVYGLRRWARTAPSVSDVIVLSLFTLFITFQPFYLRGQINVFELGLYLPGIDAVLQGMVPFRDFFHLRGPFELYMPAAFMTILGKNVAVLSTYFYIGNVLTLVAAVLVAREMLQQRGFLYLLVPVLVARTFPRVVFTFWGGMRFALGFLVVYCLIKFFKSNKPAWLFAAGVLSAVCFFTSVEIGVGVIAAAVAAVLFAALFIRKDINPLMPSSLTFLSGLGAVALPYCIYLTACGALGPYLDSMRVVLTAMPKIFLQTEKVPANLGEALLAMVNPGSKNFRHMTPAYCYLALAVVFFMDFRRKQLTAWHAALMALAVYGFVMYIGAFRNLWASQFEIALQPEKIILFVILERIFQALKAKAPSGKKIQNVFIGFTAVLVLSSLIYAVDRFQKRFYPFQVLFGKKIEKIKPLAREEVTVLNLDRISGMTVPSWQADDFKGLTGFLDSNAAPGDPVLMFPEMGAHYFIAGHPFVGRFPMVSMSWMDEQWHAEFMNDLRAVKPRWAVVPKKFPPHFETQYFRVAGNKLKFDEVLEYINENYRLATTTSSLNIFVLK